MDLSSMTDTELLAAWSTFTPEQLGQARLLMLTRAVQTSTPAPEGTDDRVVTTAASSQYVGGP